MPEPPGICDECGERMEMESYCPMCGSTESNSPGSATVASCAARKSRDQLEQENKRMCETLAEVRRTICWLAETFTDLGSDERPYMVFAIGRINHALDDDMDYSELAAEVREDEDEA